MCGEAILSTHNRGSGKMERTPHHFASVFLRRRDGGRHGREVTGWRMDADRDRGTPHGVAPPTPPGIRVRTTAVRPGKQSGPLERRQSERGEERAGKRPAECGGESDAPRSAVAASREVGVLAVHPAFAQLAVSEIPSFSTQTLVGSGSLPGGGVHLGSGAAVRSGSGSGEDGRH